MLRRISEASLAGLLQHLFGLRWVVLRSASVSEQLRVVHVLVFDQVVGILRRDDIVAGLDGLGLFLAVLGTETTEVLQTILTAWLLHGSILVVVALKRSLSGLENRVRLVAV